MDEELEEISKIIMGKLERDWTILLAYLDIPDHMKMGINDPQLTTRERIMKLLRDWRNLQKDKSTLRSVLAEKLSRADRRLHEAVRLLSTKDHHNGY